MRHSHGETVTVHPFEGAGDDGLGNPVEQWGDDYPLEGCAVEPRVQDQENAQGRRAVIFGYTVYAAFDTPVQPDDQITVRGVRCLVDGEIAPWRNPFTGAKPGAVINLLKVNG